MNMRRIQAIFEKDLKDFMKNTSTLFMPIIPVFLAIIYSQINKGAPDKVVIMMDYIVVGITFSAVTAGGIMMMMAEEKEKKTLRGLMLSPASFADIIIGKSLVTTCLTAISLIISLWILGAGPLMELRAIIGLIILFLFFLFLGMGVGLFAKTVGITTAYLMPIMFIFGFTPMLSMMGLSDSSLAIKIADYFPLPQLINMYDSHSWMPIAVVAIWAIAAALFTLVCYKRTSKD